MGEMTLSGILWFNRLDKLYRMDGGHYNPTLTPMPVE